jgi:cell wall-associated NlpC family hydrolase
MSPFFEQADVDLDAIAARWVGTPFAPAGAICGPRGGASCHRLVVAVLAEAGVPISQEEIPDAVLNRATHFPGSLMAEWLRAKPDRFDEMDSAQIRAGDILLFKFGVGAHHAGLALSGQRLLQTWQHAGAHITRYDAPPLHKRLYAVFRPLKTD